MLKKPQNYDSVEVNDLEFTPIEIGGHKCVIMTAEEYTSPISGQTSLRVVVDTDKMDKQPNYFADLYRNDTRTDKKWSNSAIKYVSLKDDENCTRMLKSFLTSVEESNPGFKYNWDAEVNQLKGKKVGAVFGLEEYQDNEGKTKTSTKIRNFRDVNKVSDVAIPKVRLLDGTYVDYETYKSTDNDLRDKLESFGSVVQHVSSSDLPF